MKDINDIYAHFINYSGHVMLAVVSRSGFVEEANSTFQTLFGVHRLIESIAILPDELAWIHLLPDSDRPEVIKITSPEMHSDVIAHLYPYGDRILLIGIQTDNDLLLSRVSTDFASMAFADRQRRRVLTDAAAASKADAHTDPLTHLKNRRWLELYAAQMEKSERPFSAAMLDIDHFKRVNDRFGHSVGDEVLEAVAGKIASTCRDSDIVVRYGGEEFAIILPNAALADATKILRRVRMNISETVQLPDQSPVTVSIGATACELGETLDMVLIRADKALYQAKENGRNQVVSASPRGKDA